MGVTARDVVVRRGSFVLDVDAFHANAGGTVLLGPNGAGKTTLLLALRGLIDADGRFERPRRTAFVFAHPAVLRGSVEWNVAVVCETVLDVGRNEAQRRARAALREVALDDRAGADARQLSTGQRQRLALARALVVEPEALFLDEPFANLDADARPALRAMIRSYVARTGCVVVLATSLLADALAVCRDVVVLRQGRVVHRGSAASLAAADDSYVRALLQENAATPRG